MTKNQMATPYVWTVDEAAHLMRIGRVTLYKLLKNGELRAVKIGGRTLIPASEISRLTTLNKSNGFVPNKKAPQ